MSKWTRKDENKSAPPIPSAASPVRSISSHVQTTRLQSVESLVTDVTHIGKSIVI